MEAAADFTQPVPVFQQPADVGPGQTDVDRARLAAMVGIPAQVEGNAGSKGDVAVPGAVDDQIRLHSLRALLGLDDYGLDAAVPDDDFVDKGVQLDVHALPAEEIIQVDLQELAVEPVGGVGPQIVTGILAVKAFLHFPGDSLGRERRAFHEIIAGFHITGGHVAAQEAALLQQHGLHAHAGRRRRGACAGGAAADHQDLYMFADRDAFLRYGNVHRILPPLLSLIPAGWSESDPAVQDAGISDLLIQFLLYKLFHDEK